MSLTCTHMSHACYVHTMHAMCALVHIACTDHISATKYHRHILFLLLVTREVLYMHTYDLSTLGAHKMHTVHARCAIVHTACTDHIYNFFV